MRFEDNPLAKVFLDRQAIAMPAYEGLLSDEEVDALVAYVRWVRDPGEDRDSLRRRALPVSQEGDPVLRGEYLYRSAGCAACHGAAGEGGVPNAHAPGGFVPELSHMAERMELFEPEEIEAVLSILRDGSSLDHPAVEPPFEYFEDVLDAYLEVRDVIVHGRMTPGATEGELPAMRMPAWSERTGADGSPLSSADVDALIAYLLSVSESS